MSQYERRMEYLHRYKVTYKRDPITDKPTEVFDWGNFYEGGTHECYTLFNSKAKITTYKSLKWHLYVLWYLNPQMDQEDFNMIAKHVSKKENGFVTFTVSDQLLDNMIYDVSLMDLDKPPPNKLRKIIFKDFSGLTMREKLSIVGKMVGRKSISESEIYDAMILINNENEKITITKLSKELKCSARTIHRNMGNELKKEKTLLNQQL
ncbi:MAG: HTH domain-containing protein [Clostridium sp.]|jgi:hypothetical protein|tara:strand:+ start:868 stop:1488 length:621 start_codon:yes stop_codon:yes gene_type:complete